MLKLCFRSLIAWSQRFASLTIDPALFHLLIITETTEPVGVLSFLCFLCQSVALLIRFQWQANLQLLQLLIRQSFQIKRFCTCHNIARSPILYLYLILTIQLYSTQIAKHGSEANSEEYVGRCVIYFFNV